MACVCGMGCVGRLGSSTAVCMCLPQLRRKLCLTKDGSVWGGSNLSVPLHRADSQAEESELSLTGVSEGSPAR